MNVFSLPSAESIAEAVKMIRWTPERQAELVALVEARKTQRQIAEAMGTTKRAINARMTKTRLPSRASSMTSQNGAEPEDTLRARWAAKIPGMKAALRTEIEAGQ